ncbi:MAG: hypothetical protein ACQGVC_05805 [Myxococcota bacterium]
MLFAIPAVVRCLCSNPPTPGLLNSAWAAAGGILGALVNVVSLQINHQSLTEPVKRGLTFGPGLGATVAWFVYLGALFDVVTINIGAPSEGPPSFPRAVVLGGLAGFGWDVVLGRIRARAKEFTEEE